MRVRGALAKSEVEDKQRLKLAIFSRIFFTEEVGRLQAAWHPYWVMTYSRDDIAVGWALGLQMIV